MAEELFQFLDENGLSAEHFLETIDQFTPEQLLSKISEASSQIPEKAPSIISPFQFVANSSMAGDRNPCAAASCRLNKVSNLAKVAALYAERILIPRPFDSIEDLDEEDINENVKEELCIIVSLLHYLRPLFDAGLLGFVSNMHYCMGCYSDQLGDVSGVYKDKFDGIKAHLIELYSQEVKYTLKRSEHYSLVLMDGPEHLIEHTHLQSFLSEDQPVLDLLGSKNKRELTPGESIEYNLSTSFVEEIMNDLVVHNWHAVLDGANYITSREIDEEIFSTVRTSTGNNQNEIVNRALSHHLPVIDGSSIKNLIKLREQEGESFQVYRDALAITLNNKHLSLKELQQAFDDVVRPELNKIELSIKNSRKILKDSIRQDVVLGAGFVSLGLFGGFLPPNIGELVAAIGGFQYTSDLIGKVNSLTKEPEGLPDEQFYYLWKASKASSKELL